MNWSGRGTRRTEVGKHGKKAAGKAGNAKQPEEPGVLDRPLTGLPVFFLIVLGTYVLVLAFGTWCGRLLLKWAEFLFLMPFLFFFQAFPRVVGMMLEFLLFGILGFVLLALVHLVRDHHHPCH